MAALCVLSLRVIADEPNARNVRGPVSVPDRGSTLLLLSAGLLGLGLLRKQGQ